MKRTAKQQAAFDHIVALCTESHLRWLALRDLLEIFDRKEMHQWSIPEVLRLEEIRSFVTNRAAGDLIASASKELRRG